MRKILYISYDGMTDPLGYSQVFRYLEILAREFKIILVSFEKKDLKKTKHFLELKKKAKDLNLTWFPLTYHKAPTVPATCFDILQGVVLSFFLACVYRVHLIHVRSYVAGLIGWVVKKLCRKPLLFDMRGFWADERVEGGLWKKESRKYKVSKFFERRFFCDAETIISLSYKGKEVIESFDYLRKKKLNIEVIPTCADLTKFYPQKSEKKFGERFVVGYSGSIGLWYDFPATLRAFIAFKKRQDLSSPFLLILNKGEHERIYSHLEDFGLDKEDYILLSSHSDDMPYWINQMDVNVYFIRPSFSKQASAPTKLAEILACGKSVLTNDFVGDSGRIIRDNRVGVLTSNFEEKEILRAVDEWNELSLDKELTKRCVETARKYFSLETGVKAYSRIYSGM